MRASERIRTHRILEQKACQKWEWNVFKGLAGPYQNGRAESVNDPDTPVRYLRIHDPAQTERGAKT
jgi:hypothetical protein